MRSKQSKDRRPSEDDTNVIQTMVGKITLEEVDAKITNFMKNLPWALIAIDFHVFKDDYGFTNGINLGADELK